MLSLTADYALRAVLVLARGPKGSSVRADRIAAAIGAPRNYLAKTMHALTKAGIVTSSRGPAGGFMLAVEPSALFVSRVADVFDEQRPHVTCLLGRLPCDAAHPCAAHVRWSAMTNAARAALSSTSIADLLGDSAA
jgi:Rrf2 family protein